MQRRNSQRCAACRLSLVNGNNRRHLQLIIEEGSVDVGGYQRFILLTEAQKIITKEFIGISDRQDVKPVFTRDGLKLHYADLSLAELYDEITKKFDTVFKIR